MGVKVVPKNLNERQIKRVDKIAATNPNRATKVANRIDDRRDARGAENPRLAAKSIMKKGGKVAKSPAQKKFAALAAPKNKITFADKIAGAKKKK